jgi:pilus assembly protein Flp/PilA
LLRDDSGATAIEYGLIAAMIAVVLISIAGTGGAVEALYGAFAGAADAMANAQ